MINKVVYIGYQPLTTKVKSDFYFEQVTKVPLNVQYWDLSGIYFDNINKDNSHSRDEVVEINNISLLKSLLIENHTTSIFVLLVSYEGRVLNLFRLLTKYNCRLIFFARGAQPIIQTKAASIFLILSIFNIKKLKNKFFNFAAYFLKKFNIIKTYDLVLRSGSDSVRVIGIGSKFDNLNSRIVDINSFDYDNYLESLYQPNEVESKYCVFLDEYLPFHPDFKLFDVNVIEPNNYYLGLNVFFSLVEKRFNVKVVIAAHPKADLYKKLNYFKGRNVVFGKSANLVKNAEFVIVQNSSSINFAVLNKKPIISLTSNDILNVMPDYNNNILAYSNALATLFLNVNEVKITDLDGFSFNLTQDQISKYEEFKFQFLTSVSSEGIKSDIIFINELIKING
jgi:hypothetical protein